MKRIIEIIIACVLFLGLTACGSDESTSGNNSNQSTTNSNKDLASILSSHTWVNETTFKSSNKESRTFEFMNDGSFVFTYKKIYSDSKKENDIDQYNGYWQLTNTNSLVIEFSNYEGEEDKSTQLNTWNDNVTDDDCSRILNDDIPESLEHNWGKYNWYVSEKYLFFSNTVYSAK